MSMPAQIIQSSARGLAASTVVFMVLGIIVLALAIFFIYTAVVSQKSGLTESDCKAVMGSECSICLTTGGACKLDSKSIECAGVLGGVGISVGGDGSFSPGECNKILPGCGKVGQQCCPNNVCTEGVCNTNTRKCG